MTASLGPGRRRGFSLLEVQAAFAVLGFSVAALFPFAVAQLKLVSALERRLPPGTTFVLVSRDSHVANLITSTSGDSTSAFGSSPMVAASGSGLGGSVGSGSRAVVIDSVAPGDPDSMEMNAVVTVKPPSPAGGGS